MAKFSGIVGFVYTEEESPGVYVEKALEKHYSGDLLRNSKQWQKGESLNDDTTINNLVSIVADAYANNNLALIRYVVFGGSKWKVKDIDVQAPRLILSIGGVYNGN